VSSQVYKRKKNEMFIEWRLTIKTKVI